MKTRLVGRLAVAFGSMTVLVAVLGAGMKW